MIAAIYAHKSTEQARHGLDIPALVERRNGPISEEVTMPARDAAVEQQLLGVWKLESMYHELKTTGEKKYILGAKPNGYIIFTPEKRMMALLTTEGREKPNTDEDCMAAFMSMVAYSGIYRVEGDKWTTRVDVAWNEMWTGSDQIRFFKLEGDKLTVSNPELRDVLVWSRVKGQA